MKVKKYLVGIILVLSSISNSHGSDWCVQVSTFRNIDGIKQDFKKVKTHKDARIEKIGGIYSLRVGYFDTESRAKEELKSIQNNFPKAIVRKCANDPNRVIESSPSLIPKRNAKRAGKPIDETADKLAKNPQPSVSSPRIAGKPAPSSSMVTPPATSSHAAASMPMAKVPDPVLPSGSADLKHAPPPLSQAGPATSAVPKPVAPNAALPPPASSLSAAPLLSEASGPVSSIHAPVPQNLFDEAEKHRGNGNYTLAIDLYKKVVQFSVPDSELAGRASYRTALCYDVIGDKKASEAGYAQAVEKWPGLDLAPAPIHFDGGLKVYGKRNYDGALKLFSLHMAAYPDDHRKAEYMAACTLLQQGRVNAAMFLFMRIIERYPDSSEAIESIVAFGNIGLMVPRVRATMFMKGWEWYRDPVHAYDTALKMEPDKATAERILYIKGCALMVLGRHDEAHRVLTKCLRTYALSQNIRIYRAAVGFNLPHLCKIYYEREDYAGVVGVYFQSAGNEVPLPVDAVTVITIGRSLHRMGLNEDASNFLKAARIKSFGKDEEEIGRAVEELGKIAGPPPVCEDVLKDYRELQSAGKPIPYRLAFRAADCLFMGRQFGDCLPIYKWVLGHSLKIDEKRWVLFRTGQASLKVGDMESAKKAFDELKATGTDEFWSKLADFAYEDGKWTEKYNRVLKKK